jgi:hypothetical protein
MKHMALVPLGRARSNAAGPRQLEQVVRIDPAAASERLHGLWCGEDGTLQVKRLNRGNGTATKSISAASSNGSLLAAAVKCVPEDGLSGWYAVPLCNGTGVNGFAHPLPLFRLAPGTLFSVGQHFWWVTEISHVEPQPAPPDVADSLCPICGSKLSEAPVVQCPGENCSRWTHLEQPQRPDAADALNCYLLADRCGGCLHPTTLAPVLVPEPPEQLFRRDNNYPDDLEIDEKSSV